MKTRCDVLIIGTGTAAHNVAHPCARADLDVVVVDARAYGGTCARRGCQPKKLLVAAAAVVAAARDLQGRGLGSVPVLAWSDLMRAKRAFTDAVPARTEEGFRRAGITTLHGRARFDGPASVRIDGPDPGTIEAGIVVVASGARPVSLPFPGADLLTTSEEFLDLDALPRRLVCVGGGYISMEFAHVAAQAGVKATVLQRGPRILPAFDQDLVGMLTTASGDLGIDVRTDAEVTSVERHGQGLLVRTGDGGESHAADLVLHGAGRVPDLDDLDLERAGVAYSSGGITVDAGLRSTTNPAVLAVGDAADRPPRLAPTADREGQVAAANIIAGRTIREMGQAAVPSVVFTHPRLASVGMGAAAAAASGPEVTVRSHDTGGWPSSRRLGQRHGGCKVMLETSTGRILGAHVLGPGADDVINVFALAIHAGLTAGDLQEVLWAYPTATSDIKRMLAGEPEA